jgi:hypothetical protein
MGGAGPKLGQTSPLARLKRTGEVRPPPGAVPAVPPLPATVVWRGTSTLLRFSSSERSPGRYPIRGYCPNAYCKSGRPAKSSRCMLI